MGHVHMADSVAAHRQRLRVPSVPPIDADAAVALGTRMKELRQAAGLTQEKLAHRAGISRNHVQLIEKGLSDRSNPSPWNPHLSTLVALCEALGVSVTQVVDVFDAPPHGTHVEYDAG